ncbi:heme-binding domain-containing protein [uncultured Cytophaga sp.]|uniref:heme-binding domain-containing protein n=1 Tax=uncultured Cytophaga sp. TaxID=160238 RepID=UPI00261BBD71|nr:heme-binding domain-containing protein [uncultured Cytophaga sp.]
MNKVFKRIGLLLFISVVGIQFIPTTLNESDNVLSTDFIKTYSPPKNIKNLLINSCYDCHSNNTKYPWYNKIQPVSWFIESHIESAKTELNFSEFGNYSTRKKKSKLKSILSQIKNDKMPLPSYILMHKESIFSKSNKLDIEKWLTELEQSTISYE